MFASIGLAMVWRLRLQESPPPLRTLHGWLKICGIALAAGGAITMLLAHSDGSQMVNELTGNICALLNTVFFAIYMTLQVYSRNQQLSWYRCRCWCRRE